MGDDLNIRTIQPSTKCVRVNLEKIKVEENRNKKKKHERNGKEINCQICDYSTKLTQHLEKHYGNNHFKQELRSTCAEVSKNLICNICEYSAKQKRDMNDHIGSKHGYINKILIRKGYSAIKKKIRSKETKEQTSQEFRAPEKEPSILENILGFLSQKQDSSDAELCEVPEKYSPNFNTDEKRIFS